MTVLRMDNMLLVVDDLEAAIAFFAPAPTALFNVGISLRLGASALYLVVISLRYDSPTTRAPD